MTGERSEGPFESDPSRWRQVAKRSRVAAPLAGLGVLAVLRLGGEAAESSASPHRLASQPVPERVTPPDFTFQGERAPDAELLYWADSVANEYWDQLGRERSDCEDHLTVIFTRHFDGYDNPNRQPSAAINCSLRTEWINADPALTENPWKLAKVLAHEYGHARGLRHTHDRNSIMFAKRDAQDRGTFTDPKYGAAPPPGATVERFDRLFRERLRDLPGTESP